MRSRQRLHRRARRLRSSTLSDFDRRLRRAAVHREPARPCPKLILVGYWAKEWRGDGILTPEGQDIFGAKYDLRRGLASGLLYSIGAESGGRKDVS